MKRLIRLHWPELILSGLVLAIIARTLYHRVPIMVSMPDILYVKAKIMWILRGDIFTDPITGYDTMHPPWLHVILAPFYAIGISRDAILSFVSVFNIALLFFFTYKSVAHVFDRRVAFWTCLMLPFIVEYMGPRNILLSTSFYFSIPFYLAGLWMYLRSESSIKGTVGTAVFWGVAFLISPVYLFLIGLTFLYEALVKKRLRRFLILVGVFAIMLIPFYIQLYTVYLQGLGETQTFSLWRGMPGAAWWRVAAVEFISPTTQAVLSFPAIAHMIIIAAGILVIVKTRAIHWIIPLSLMAYVLTFYHFSGQYAIRIQLFFSIFLIAVIVSWLQRYRQIMVAWAIPLIGLAVFALYTHHVTIGEIYENETPLYYERLKVSEELRKSMDNYLRKDTYIFSGNNTYLRYIMPYYPVHCLGAYRSMEYFQLPDSIANELHRDDTLSEGSSDYALIDSIARKYDITSAVLTPVEIGVPLYETLARRWNVVYQDGYFGILKKPE